MPEPCQIGGGLIGGEGGVLQLAPLQPDLPDTGTLPFLPLPIMLDVAWWRLLRSFDEQPIAKSGGLGATSSRRCGYAYAWECEVVYDAANQASGQFRSIKGASAYFQRGSTAIEGIDEPTPEPSYWWCPQVHLASAGTRVDPSDKRFIRELFIGTANAHFLMIPEQGALNNAGTVVGAYWSHFAA